jgi:uncharacterized protein Usg
MKFFGEYSDGLRLTSIKIIYKMPDYSNILNEFWWQTLDIPPKYPRMKTFVDYWNDYIEGIIHSLEIAHVEEFGPIKWTNVTNTFKIK